MTFHLFHRRTTPNRFEPIRAQEAPNTGGNTLSRYEREREAVATRYSAIQGRSIR